MADNTIEFEIVARLDKLETALKDVEKAAEKTGDKITGSILKAEVIKAAAIKVGRYLYDGFKSSINAAMESENAVNRLNQSLANAGRYSIAASQDMQKFAASLQQTTTLTDEAVMSSLALANNYARSNEEAKKLTQAAIDMAAATGVSAETAIRTLGASLNGMGASLGKVVPQVKGLTEEQLRAGAALDLIANRFKGAAANEINTFAGALKQLENLWGDVGEETGKMIVQSPAVVAAIKFVTKWVGELVTKMQEFSATSGDSMRPIILGLLDVAKVLNYGLVGPLEFIWNLSKIVFESIRTGAQAIIYTIATSVQGLLQIAGLFTDKFKDAEAAVTQFTQSSGAVLEDFANNNLEAVSETFNFSGTTAGNSMIEGMRSAVELAGPVVTEQARKNAKNLEEVYNGISFEGLKNSFKMSAKQMNESAVSLMAGLKGSFSSGMSGAFQAMGAALVKGKNVFAEFGKAILGMFGDMAIQLGQFYFTLGLANLWLNPAAAAGQIAGGAALMVLGGALKALAGGGGGAAGAASGGASGGGASQSAGDLTAAKPQQEERQVGTNVSVNIAGSVLGDKRTLGRELADAINEAFGTDGITIARGAVV